MLGVGGCNVVVVVMKTTTKRNSPPSLTHVIQVKSVMVRSFENPKNTTLDPYNTFNSSPCNPKPLAIQN